MNAIAQTGTIEDTSSDDFKTEQLAHRKGPTMEGYALTSKADVELYGFSHGPEGTFRP